MAELINYLEEIEVHYWICDLCGTKENMRAAFMVVGPTHRCSA